MQTHRLTAAILLTFATAATFTLAKNPYSIGLPDAVWRTPTLKVCWQNSRSQVAKEVSGWAKHNYHAETPSADFRDRFAGWVRGSYSHARVGVGFEGFDECPEDPAALADYPVYLVGEMELSNAFMHFLGIHPPGILGISVIGDQNRYLPLRDERVPTGSVWPRTKATGRKLPYKAAVGFDFEGADKPVAEYFARIGTAIESMLGLDYRSETPNALQKEIRRAVEKEAALQREDSHKFTALHELGHLVGLLHEDRRLDAKVGRPKYCLNVAGDSGQEDDGSFSIDESVFGTEYDPFSIMSYCRDTMHRLFHHARLVCRLAPKFDENLRYAISDFLKNCEEIEKTEFPVDLTRRDVNALRQAYLHESPKTGADADFRKSPEENRLFRILDEAARLPFDQTTKSAMEAEVP